ncbi:Sphingosine N-acyltransferase lag1 [Saxophila tyrrhenica]|uniref:Sphingosine N-acyltransferase lag1 n=1 Tax=Saxophila tyrrhenica TaxID=1690608 RepID=A0AAV9PEF6_9PEZI|nr:Sphingosine N-acyltransferase lag1 [Saxophila tyrrhenica]
MATRTPRPSKARPSNGQHSVGPTALSPPQVRQPFTPPPRSRDDDDNADGNEEVVAKLQQLQAGKGSISGGLNPKPHGSFNIEDMAVCASPGEFARAKRKSDGSRLQALETQSLATMLRKGIVKHQLGLSLNLIILLGMSWCLFPSLRQTLEAFFTLSYQSNLPGQEAMYGEGLRDLYFVAAFTVLLIGVRAFMLDYVLTPLAGLWGIRNPRTRDRFAEQSFLLLYYIIFWNWGLYLFISDTPSLSASATAPTSSAFSNLLISLWTGFPRLLVHSSMKLYYLSQLAFWIKEILVVHLEEKRKDHYQMLTHHLVTVALMATSYGYRQWRVGNAVLVAMDIVEIIFPTAKILKYLGLQAACDFAFGMFVFLWLIARHGCYLTICWSIYAHVNEVVMPYGTYSLNETVIDHSSGTPIVSGARLGPDGGEDAWRHIFQPFVDTGAETVSFNAKIRWSFLGLLLGLQCITLLWFFMICRVVLKVLRGEGADDTRSDDEGEDEEEENSSSTLTPDSSPGQPITPTGVPYTMQPEKQRFIEIEADSTEYVRRTPSRSGTSPSGNAASRSRKGNAFASGLNLGEHKDILNRIGCLSEEQLAREREKKGER